jgi:glutathione peroxidase-family protein
MTSEGCVLVAQFGFLLDFVFGKVSDSGFGVAGFPCEGTADVCTV